MPIQPRLDDLLELRHQARAFGLASNHLVNTAFSGLYASVFRGSGLEFEEVREYREGDDIRNMDWHVTARTNRPYLKVFREERERSVVLCVDGSSCMSFGTRGTFKSVQAARAAALIGWAANSLQDRVGGVVYGRSRLPLQYFQPSRGRRALWRVLKALTQPEEEGQCEVDALLEALQKIDRGASTGSLIFVIGALDREVGALEHILGNLQQRHSTVLLPVDDAADWELPDMGRVLFSGPDGALMELDTQDESGRTAYRTRWQSRREELTGLATRLGIPLVPIDTDRDVHRALMEGLSRRLRAGG